MYYKVVTIIILCLNYSICEQVDSSQQLSSFDKLMLPNDTDPDGIHKFFSHLKKFYFNEVLPHSVIVFGRTYEHLWKTKPLFDHHPSFIFTKTTNGGLHQDRLSKNDFLVVFLRDLTEQTLKNDVDIFSRRRVKRVVLIFEGVIHAKSDISSLVALANEMNIDFPIFAHVNGNVVKFYSQYYAKDCSLQVRVMLSLNAGDDFDRQVENMNTWMYRVPQHNRCPVTVMTWPFPPKMWLSWDFLSRSWKITGGRDGKLVLAVAKKLNYTVVIKKIPKEDLKISSQQEIIIQKVAEGSADIGIGRLRRVNNKDNEFIKYSQPYDFECITWAVPRVLKLSTDIVTVELTWQLWVLVGLVFVIGFMTYYYLQKFDFRENDNKNEKGFFFVFLDVVAIHLGIPAIVVPAPLSGKFSLLAFLCYAMVLTTAYKTSLASILVTENGTPAIVDAQGIIDANLTIKGSEYSRNILRNLEIDEKTKMKLLERFVIENDFNVIGQQLNENSNVAALAQASSLYFVQQYFIRNRGSVNFDILQNCVLFHQTSMIVKKSTILRRIDVVIRRLEEAGILKQWDKHENIDVQAALKEQRDRLFFENRGGAKFKSIFLLYFCCIAVSIFTFVIELIVYAKSNP